MDHLRTAIKYVPNYFNAYIMLIQCALSLEELEYASKIVEEGIKRFAGDSTAMVKLHRIKLNLLNTDKSKCQRLIEAYAKGLIERIS
jgi:hypothetical protein